MARTRRHNRLWHRRHPMVVVRDERTVNPSFGKPGDARLGRSLAGQTGGSTKRWPGVGAPASAKRRRPDIVAKDAKTVSLLRCARASVTRGVSLRPLRRSGVAPFACAGWGLAGASAVAAEECEAVCDPVSFAKQPRAGICRQEDPAVCSLPRLWLFYPPASPRVPWGNSGRPARPSPDRPRCPRSGKGGADLPHHQATL